MLIASSDDKVDIEASTFQLTIERIHSIGIDDRTIDAVNETMKSMEESFEKNDVLDDYWKKLKDSHSTFSYSHSYLTSLFLHKIIDNFSWSTPAIKGMLTFISYFHDIALKSDDIISMSKQENLIKNVPIEFRNLIDEHAYRGASIVGKYPNAPAGAAQIISEHHGSVLGMGLETQIDKGLQPLSKVFIVVEQFVVEYLKSATSPSQNDFSRIFNDLRLRFKDDLCLEAITVLENAVLNKQ